MYFMLQPSKWACMTFFSQLDWGFRFWRRIICSLMSSSGVHIITCITDDINFSHLIKVTFVRCYYCKVTVSLLFIEYESLSTVHTQGVYECI
jgi:hypothetical protein